MLLKIAQAILPALQPGGGRSVESHTADHDLIRLARLVEGVKDALLDDLRQKQRTQQQPQRNQAYDDHPLLGHKGKRHAGRNQGEVGGPGLCEEKRRHQAEDEEQEQVPHPRVLDFDGHPRRRHADEEQVSAESVGLSDLAFERRAEPLSVGDLKHPDHGHDKCGQEQKEHKAFDLGAVAHVVDHHEEDDEIFKILEHVEGAGPQLDPAGHEAEAGGQHWHATT